MISFATGLEQSTQFWDGERDENVWGYGKRVRFVANSIIQGFPGSDLASIRVLDVGCGNGWFLAVPLARRGFDVTGIDLHEPSIDRARHFADGLTNVRFAVGTVSELGTARFDVVILSEVLEHVSDPKALLLASLERLKPDGIVLITVPNGYGEFEIDSWIFRTLHLQGAVDFLKRVFRNYSSEVVRGQQDLAATDNTECGHVHFFRHRQLKLMFTECSLNTVRESAGSFMCGPIVCYTVARSRRFIDWNVRVTEKLPLTLSSSWYFVLRRRGLSVAGII